MPPTTKELEAVKVNLEKKISDGATRLENAAERLERRSNGMVTKEVCEARTEMLRSAMNTLTEGFKAVTTELKGLRADTNKKLDEEREDRRRREAELTDRISAPIQPTPSQVLPQIQDRKPLLEKLGNNAKALTAIILLIVMLAGGCITGAWYVVGAMTVLKRAVDEQQALVNRTEHLVQKQTNIAKEIREEAAPQMHFYPLPPDAGRHRQAKPPRRRPR